jgi:predicted RNA binding protein YcfA (HicA-like mRNA interferase family)
LSDTPSHVQVKVAALRFGWLVTGAGGRLVWPPLKNGGPSVAAQSLGPSLSAFLPWESMKVRDVIKMVEEDGWKLARQKGSHRQFQHPDKPGTVTIAGHPSTEMPIGTLKNVKKQAGLDK